MEGPVSGAGKGGSEGTEFRPGEESSDSPETAAERDKYVKDESPTLPTWVIRWVLKPSIHLYIHSPIYLPIYSFTFHPSIPLSIHPTTHLPSHPPIHLSIHALIHPTVHPSTLPPIHLPISLSIHPSTHQLSIHTHINHPPILCPSTFSKWL